MPENSTHLYKIQLQMSDMFVKELDFNTQMIRYQIRDKSTGVLLESESYVKFDINDVEQKIEFGSRFINLGFAIMISDTLKS